MAEVSAMLPATNALLKSIEFWSTPAHTLGPFQTLAFERSAVVHLRSWSFLAGMEVIVVDDDEPDALF